MNKNEAQKEKSKFAIFGITNSINWKTYLDDLHNYLTDLGFKRYKQNLKSEDFAYWKKYEDKYQIGLFVYDWRKYPQHEIGRKVSIQYECMLLDIDGRCDLSVSKDIELKEFEEIAKSFYNSISKYC